MKNKIYTEINDHIDLLTSHREVLSESVLEISAIIKGALKRGKKILLFGNGGSAADAQHIAAEFTGRYVKERSGLSAIALTTDSSALTAIGNDYGFERIFERQVEALGNEGDVLIGISTSGNSENVKRGLIKGRERSCICVSLTGNQGGSIKEISDYNINILHRSTARIQEMHILIGHLVCSCIDE
jgi:D-sedoheptulose 7-phosphate isomerase